MTVPAATFRARVTSKGQLTVPKAVRLRLGIDAGDVLEFVEIDGRFQLRKRVEGSWFARHVGRLGHVPGSDTDALVEDLRGPPDDVGP